MAWLPFKRHRAVAALSSIILYPQQIATILMGGFITR